jgi:peptidyl-prolyl cis-trans isomerase A (cyclophilin A)
MVNMHRPAFLLLASTLFASVDTACAFSTAQPPTHHVTATASSTSLHATATKSSATQQPRRKVLRNIRRTVVGAATLAAFRQGPKMAVADDTVPTTGRIVEMEVSNLDGIPGKTGVVKIQLRPEWAPTGVKRFETLTSEGFYDNCRMFRVLPGFVAQFGINGKPEIQSEWRSKSIPDDAVKVSNSRGTVVFATAGPNSRTTQIFFNTREEGNTFLDKQGFAPFGQVIEGMDIVDKFYSGYGEGAPAGQGPNQALVQARGDSYLSSFPKLTYIKEAKIV